MPNTTNFNFPTPADTDLVKDGASAIRSLGNSIDTAFVDLKGGTTGQVLAKASNTDLDFTWSSVDPLTILDAKGDLISATAADTPARLASSGVNGDVLTVDTSTATGLKWAAPAPSGGMTLISTSTPSGATTVSFTSIPTTYKALLLVWDQVFQNNDNENFSLRLNNDSASNYFYAGLSVSAGTPTAENESGTAFGSNTQNSPIPRTTTSSTTYVRQAHGHCWIFNADQTTNPKRIFYTSTGHTGTQPSGPIAMNGLYRGTSAISRIDFIRSSTQTITGTIRLYGVS